MVTVKQQLQLLNLDEKTENYVKIGDLFSDLFNKPTKVRDWLLLRRKSRDVSGSQGLLAVEDFDQLSRARGAISQLALNYARIVQTGQRVVNLHFVQAADHLDAYFEWNRLMRDARTPGSLMDNLINKTREEIVAVRGKDDARGLRVSAVLTYMLCRAAYGETKHKYNYVKDRMFRIRHLARRINILCRNFTAGILLFMVHVPWKSQ